VNYVSFNKNFVTDPGLPVVTFNTKYFKRISYKFNLKNNIMSLLTIIIVLIVTGVVLWLINSFIPMQSTVKRILNVVVVIVLIVWLLKAFGLFDSLLNIRV